MDDTKLNLVIDSWSETYKYSPECKYLTYNYYKKFYIKIIKNILARPHIQLNYKTREKDGKVLSWICYEGDVLHYVYTKQAYRKKSYMKELLKDAGFKDEIKCSHMNVAFKRIFNNKAIYQPFYKYNNV